MTNRLISFLHTRSGYDAYTLFLLIVSFFLQGLTRFTRLYVLLIPAYLALFYCLFRFFSRDRAKRRAENARFVALFQALTQWLRFCRNVHTDKEHRYFKCPNCGQPLRVPRGKGKVQISCRTCGVNFEKKT